MQKKRINRTTGKGCIVLLVLTFLCINILVADISVPEAPVEIEIEVSKDKIYVGDSLDVYATISLLKNHRNFDQEDNYHVKLLPNINWEILYSDSDKIINFQNQNVSFHYRIMLLKKPTFITVHIPRINVYSFEMVDIGNEMMESLITEKLTDTMIECLNEGLIKRPDRRTVSGATLQYDPDLNPNVLDMSRTIPIKPDDLVKIIKVDDEFLEKYSSKEYYDVLINSTIEWQFQYNVSNVSCDASIGNAYQSGSNLITLESESTVGAQGYVYFTMNGQNWQFPIELIANYHIEGSFKYEKSGNDDYINAKGVVGTS